MFGQPNDDLKFSSNTNDEPNAFSPTEVPLEDDMPLFSPVDGQIASHDFGFDSFTRLGTPAGGDSWESFVDFGPER